MNSRDETPPPDPDAARKDLVETINGVRDLGDFCLAWPKLRPRLEEERERQRASELGLMLHWLILLTDRVCQTDLPEET